MIDKLIWLVFNTHAIVYLFCAIGALATLTWLWDNLASLVSIVKTVLMPYFLPGEGFTLADKFGNWAGRCRQQGIGDYGNRRDDKTHRVVKKNNET